MDGSSNSLYTSQPGGINQSSVLCVIHSLEAVAGRLSSQLENLFNETAFTVLQVGPPLVWR